MALISTAGTNMASSVERGTLSDEFLNAYLISNAMDFRWPVRLYSVNPASGESAAHEERGRAKNAIWRLRENHRTTCRGFGFVVDVNAETVAIPADWQIPAAEVEVDGSLIDFQTALVTSTGEPRHRTIIEGILREETWAKRDRKAAIARTASPASISRAIPGRRARSKRVCGRSSPCSKH
jgi:hypothetical protein